MAGTFLVVVALILAVCGIAVAPANADTAPTDGSPETVAADALSTWQVNGVVWSQVVVGNIVYATGSFTQVRPPGVAVGGAGSITANNIFAYNITTGAAVTTFSANLSAQGLVVRAAPDGSAIYVGGDFTTVNGAVHNHLVALNPTTGAVINTFPVSVGAQVAALAVTASTVYVGGNFQAAGGQTRVRLASFARSNGALQSWAPTADDYKVTAMVMAPDNSRVIVGGSFTTMNGQPAMGMGSVDATTGATEPWAANHVITDGGNKCGILSLSSDGTQIFGSGYAFGCGNFEGTFAADPMTGAVNLANDCHGDTYDTFPIGQVLYSVSHAHNCSFIGDFPNSNPWSINMRHALAFTTYPTGTNIGPDDYGWNFGGIPDSTLLQWFPVLVPGSYTGQSQAAWSVAGNSQYVVLGGEFPTVNGASQQGLVRFAVKTIAPNKRGPVSASSAPAPSAQSFSSGQVRVAWQSAYDMDNKSLTYTVTRSGTVQPVYTKTLDSTYWNYPMTGFIDKNVTPGASYTYTVKVTDPFGNAKTLGTTNSVTVVSGSQSQYSQDVSNDGASDFWRLGEPSGSAIFDYVGFLDATAQSGVTRGASGAISGDSDGASSFSGSNSGFAVTNSPQPATPTFTIEAWIKTTTTRGGKIVGYGDANSGNSSNYDRHVYMDNSGHIIFGVYNNNTFTITSPNRYNDGNFHQIVASLDSANGMTLYIDGKRIGTNQGTKVGQPYNGYWRIGGDNLGGWPSQPTSAYFNGTIDDVSLYPTALSLTSVRQHYVDSGRTLTIPQPPADVYGKAVFNSGPDLYWRLADSTLSSTAIDSGPDGGNTGTYSGGVTKNQTGVVAGNSAVLFNGSTGTIGSTNSQAGPVVYSEELWFKTSTTHGGKLIGFGDQRSGLSSSYDRHVYMENSGQLTFGTWTGQTNTATSPLSYNNNQWHYMVATQGSDGMHLYVDGVEVASNPQTGQQAYNGYWRVGGDSDWGGDSPYFNGTLDEVAVYSTELTSQTVKAHFQAGGGVVVNQPPQASFTDSEAGLKLSVDGSGSSDPDGSIASYDWNWGDGSAHGSGAGPNHTYGATGDYTVTLTVTDNQGAQGVSARTIHVVNSSPHAVFTTSTNARTVSADGSGSSDSDGTIASYDWNWGDGSAHSTGASPNHTYAADGTYTITLTVTDNAGGTDPVQHDVTVSTNQSPVAAFTTTASNLTVTADGSGSSDPDGSIASYDWNWGDGTAHGTGVGPSHPYASAGTYTITLTVTDNVGGTNSVQHDVTVTAPTLLASDDFGRTTASGWGTADLGGAWTITGYAANFQVGSGVGTINVPTVGTGPTVSLNSVSTSNSDVRAVFTPQQIATGSGTYFSVLGRSVSGVGNYRTSINIKATGAVTASLVRVDGAGQATIAGPVTVTGLTETAGAPLDVRLEVTGTSPTALMAKVWKDGTAEPSSWTVSGTDSSAPMQATGSVGLMYFLAANSTVSPVSVKVDGFRVFDSTTTNNAAVQGNVAALMIAGDTVVHKSRIPSKRQRVSPPFVESRRLTG